MNVEKIKAVMTRHALVPARPAEVISRAFENVAALD